MTDDLGSRVVRQIQEEGWAATLPRYIGTGRHTEALGWALETLRPSLTAAASDGLGQLGYLAKRNTVVLPRVGEEADIAYALSRTAAYLSLALAYPRSGSALAADDRPLARLLELAGQRMNQEWTHERRLVMWYHYPQLCERLRLARLGTFLLDSGLSQPVAAGMHGLLRVLGVFESYRQANQRPDQVWRRLVEMLFLSEGGHGELLAVDYRLLGYWNPATWRRLHPNVTGNLCRLLMLGSQSGRRQAVAPE